MSKTGIQRAVEAMAAKAPNPALAADGYTELARAIGVSPQAVQKWATQGFAPVGRARQISMASGVDHRLLVDPVIRDLFENA